MWIFGPFCDFSSTFHKSHVTCHLPPVTNANSLRPSPADSSIIHSTLVPDPKNKLNNQGEKNIVKIVVSFEPIMQFYVLSDLESLETYLLLFMKNDKNLILWPLSTIATFMTDRYTYGHGNSMTHPAQRAESVKTQQNQIVTKSND